MSDHKRLWRWDETIAKNNWRGEVDIPISRRWPFRRREAVVRLDMRDAGILSDMLSSVLKNEED